MEAQCLLNYSSECLSMSDFKKLGRFIESYIGIKMPSSKIRLLESRLRKRLRVLGIETYNDYCKYLFSDRGMEKELINFINVVTTNKTDFFREPGQFKYLFEHAIPDILQTGESGSNKRLFFWSAACSRGNEPYSLAIVLSEYLRTYTNIKFEYTILATDISTTVLEDARKAIYPFNEIEPVPKEIRMRYFMKSRNPENQVARIIPELRSKIRFHRLNLMNDFQCSEQMDVIFCRNVFIYFDKKTQVRIANKLCDKLRPNGYLFMGNSEMLNCPDLPVLSVGPSIYKKNE